MYKPHGWVKSPENLDIRVWRYFKLKRFTEFLNDRALYFARYDQFDDDFEGTLPEATVPLEKDGFRHVPRTADDDLTDWEMLVRDINRLGKLTAYASCWYVNDLESDAMWRLYGKEGVAVQSTFRRLCASFEDEAEAVFVGEMKYLDFRIDQPPTYGNTLSVAFCKRKEFEAEREIRAVVVKSPAEWNSGSPPYAAMQEIHPKGTPISVNLDILIEQVVVAPRSSETFRTGVQQLLLESRVMRSVQVSRLDDSPRFL